MKKPLQVREFEKIYCAPQTDEYKGLPESVFADLENFIYAFSGNEAYADPLEFLKIGYQRNVGKYVSVNNYVGLIQMRSGEQIEVLPKIDFVDGQNEGYQKTKQIFLKMLRSMKDFPSKVFTEANLQVDKMTLYEIFINMYLQEVRTLVKHGLKSSYVYREDNLGFFKGKLIVNEHIKNNTAHKERFYIGFDEHMVDRAENRLIKATMIKLQSITESAENQKEIGQLLTAFEMVSPSVNHEKEFAHVVIDRNTKDYEMLMHWSRIFLFNKSFTTFSGAAQARALLFPMEKVFESYVARELRKALQGTDLHLTTQGRGKYLFDYPRAKFALVPDIVITRGNDSRIILDTKWKRLIDKPQVNYGISQADMYQMYAYAKKYETSDIWLLYPLDSKMKGHEEITFESNDNVKVSLFFVDVANMDESMRALKERLLG